MIKMFVGTVVINAILPIIFINFLEKNASMKSIEGIYFGDYAVSFYIFTFISSFALIIYYYTIILSNKCIWFNNDIAFFILGSIYILFSKWLYIGIIKILVLISGSKTQYFLKSYEMNWIILFICLAYAIYFGFFKEREVMLYYLSIIVSYFFWISFSKEDVKEKFKEYNKLSLYYNICIIILLLSIFSVIRYSSNNIKMIASMLGSVIGFSVGIIIKFGINAKKCEKE